MFKGLVNRTYKKLKDLLDYQNNEDDGNILNNINLEFKPECYIKWKFFRFKKF